MDHCSVLPSGRDPTFLTGVTLGQANLFLGPRFRSYARDGFLMPVIDDYENRYAWDTMCEKANLYGYKTTLAVSQTPFLDSQAKDAHPCTYCRRTWNRVPHTQSRGAGDVSGLYASLPGLWEFLLSEGDRRPADDRHRE